MPRKFGLFCIQRRQYQLLISYILDNVVLLTTRFVNFPAAGHEYFCQIPEEFIEDDFNLTGLSAVIPMYNEALDTILDMELEETPDSDDLAIIEESAEQLYGMIQVRVP